MEQFIDLCQLCCWWLFYHWDPNTATPKCGLQEDLKNKPCLVAFLESIEISLWIFLLTLFYEVWKELFCFFFSFYTTHQLKWGNGLQISQSLLLYFYHWTKFATQVPHFLKVNQIFKSIICWLACQSKFCNWEWVSLYHVPKV